MRCSLAARYKGKGMSGNPDNTPAEPQSDAGDQREQRLVDTRGGDYAEGDIDKRQGKARPAYFPHESAQGTVHQNHSSGNVGINFRGYVSYTKAREGWRDQRYPLRKYLRRRVTLMACVESATALWSRYLRR